MGTDKNTTIGFVLLAGLLFALFAINSKNRLAYEADQKRINDSITAVNQKKKQQEKAKIILTTPVSSDSLVIQKEELQVLENNLVKITLSNKGGRPVAVELKNYKTFSSRPVLLLQNANGSFQYRFKNGNQTNEISETFFRVLPVVKKSDGSMEIEYQAKTTSGSTITHRYTLKPDEYKLLSQLLFSAAGNMFDQNKLNMEWNMDLPAIEKDFEYEATQTHFCYSEKDQQDFEYMNSTDSKNFDGSVAWMGVKRQFFINAMECKTPFQSASAGWNTPEQKDSLHLVKFTSHGLFTMEDAELNQKQVKLNWYFGPSDYNILAKYSNGMETMVPYGSGIFSFVKYINRHFLLPVFDFLSQHLASMGMVILMLTLIIRLITSPILYKSYLSGAKMKALKPEIDALREKYKDDQQAIGMEQMKLWKSAGVSPLGGCIPALLQIPIFMSLYYFFQANIDLRGKTFLWANDLATYDSILQFSFNIPFYGNHVSLFTLTAVITSLLISIYGMANMQDNSNPLMKYMPYIFPVLLLGVFNNLPAALTWYYTVSNVITLLMQMVIQKYIINPDKIRAEIEENRKKPVKKSKLQERIEAMQDSQRKLQDMKKKNS
jgi:YidC/Oxa1 family membrane protein insertase